MKAWNILYVDKLVSPSESTYSAVELNRTIKPWLHVFPSVLKVYGGNETAEVVFATSGKSMTMVSNRQGLWIDGRPAPKRTLALEFKENIENRFEIRLQGGGGLRRPPFFLHDGTLELKVERKSLIRIDFGDGGFFGSSMFDDLRERACQEDAHFARSQKIKGLEELAILRGRVSPEMSAVVGEFLNSEFVLPATFVGKKQSGLAVATMQISDAGNSGTALICPLTLARSPAIGDSIYFASVDGQKDIYFGQVSSVSQADGI